MQTPSAGLTESPAEMPLRPVQPGPKPGVETQGKRDETFPKATSSVEKGMTSVEPLPAASSNIQRQTETLPLDDAPSPEIDSPEGPATQIADAEVAGSEASSSVEMDVEQAATHQSSQTSLNLPLPDQDLFQASESGAVAADFEVGSSDEATPPAEIAASQPTSPVVQRTPDLELPLRRRGVSTPSEAAREPESFVTGPDVGSLLEETSSPTEPEQATQPIIQGQTDPVEGSSPDRDVVQTEGEEHLPLEAETRPSEMTSSVEAAIESVADKADSPVVQRQIDQMETPADRSSSERATEMPLPPLRRPFIQRSDESSSPEKIEAEPASLESGTTQAIGAEQASEPIIQRQASQMGEGPSPALDKGDPIEVNELASPEAEEGVVQPPVKESGGADASLVEGASLSEDLAESAVC